MPSVPGAVTPCLAMKISRLGGAVRVRGVSGSAPTISAAFAGPRPSARAIICLAVALKSLVPTSSIILLSSLKFVCSCFRHFHRLCRLHSLLTLIIILATTLRIGIVRHMFRGYYEKKQLKSGFHYGVSEIRHLILLDNRPVRPFRRCPQPGSVEVKGHRHRNQETRKPARDTGTRPDT